MSLYARVGNQHHRRRGTGVNKPDNKNDSSSSGGGGSTFATTRTPPSPQPQSVGRIRRRERPRRGRPHELIPTPSQQPGSLFRNTPSVLLSKPLSCRQYGRPQSPLSWTIARARQETGDASSAVDAKGNNSVLCTDDAVGRAYATVDMDEDKGRSICATVPVICCETARRLVVEGRACCAAAAGGRSRYT